MKKLYIYEYVDDVSNNYHSGGGLVIITSGNPSDVWRAERRNPDREDLGEPDRIIDVADTEADAVYPFQDAGCC